MAAEPAPAQANPIAAIRELAAVVTAIAGVVVLSGGIVLALRLSYADLPWEGVLGQLPRGLLITVGLAQVLLPALVVAALHGASRAARPPREPVVHRRWRSRLLVVGLWTPVLLLVVGTAASWPYTSARSDADIDGDIILGALVCIAAALFALAEIRIRTQKGTVARRSGPPWAPVTLGYAAVAAVVATFVAATFPLADSRVCLGSRAVAGKLVTAVGERVILGEPSRIPGARGHLVAFRSADVGAVIVGGGAEDVDCAAYTGTR